MVSSCVCLSCPTVVSNSSALSSTCKSTWWAASASVSSSSLASSLVFFSSGFFSSTASSLSATSSSPVLSHFGASSLFPFVTWPFTWAASFSTVSCPPFDCFFSVSSSISKRLERTKQKQREKQNAPIQPNQAQVVIRPHNCFSFRGQLRSLRVTLFFSTAVHHFFLYFSNKKKSRPIFASFLSLCFFLLVASLNILFYYTLNV